MILKYFYDSDLAQASYMIGCPGSGDAMVIDASRHIQPYLDAAKAEGLTISSVTETHIHADYVSGSRELAAVTGAQLYLSGEGRDFMDGKFAYDFPSEAKAKFVYDGDVLHVGGVKVQVMHTPGHTPEHIIFVVTDTGLSQPVGAVTGDFLFVGDVGRPDLLEEAVKVSNTKELGARNQFKNVQRFKDMPDFLQIWPGHGAGSACGKALGAVPSTTLGYEKLFNPAFQFTHEDEFVNWLLADQPEAPRYFAEMKRVNQIGADMTDELVHPSPLSEESLHDLIENCDLCIVDVRPIEEYAAKHVKGTVNVPANERQFSTWVGWLVDYEKEMYLIAEPEELPAILRRLQAIGVDHAPHYFRTSEVLGKATPIPTLEPSEAKAKFDAGEAYLLDVRWKNERNAEFIEDSIYIPFGELAMRLEELPTDKPIITHCTGGYRSQIAASYLERYGFSVYNLRGGIDHWREEHLPVMQVAL